MTSCEGHCRVMFLFCKRILVYLTPKNRREIMRFGVKRSFIMFFIAVVATLRLFAVAGDSKGIFVKEDDSKAFYAAPWSVKTIADGVVLKSCQFSLCGLTPCCGKCYGLFGQSQNICILEISPKADVYFQIKASDTLKITSEFLDHNSIAAINGSYFNRSLAHRFLSSVYLRLNGLAVAPSNKLEKNRSNGSVLISGGVLTVAYNANGEESLDADDLMTSGPLLIDHDTLVAVSMTHTHNTNLHPRTMVGVRSDGTVLFVTVDGRAKQSEGISCQNLQLLALMLDCSYALNLDGGGSTTMVVRGEPFGGVVNYPSDNKVYDHLGERKVANVILLNAN